MYTIHCGDALSVLRDLAAASIDCCVTSPPYWGLRDYGSDQQIGLEATPEEFVAKLVAVFAEVRRVLKPEGTLWLNLGDSYTSHPGQRVQGIERNDVAGRKQSTNAGCLTTGSRIAPNLKAKNLIGIPWRVAFALQADGWWLRSDIVWAKPAPMPESVTDRPTRSHEFVFLLAKEESYYYDAEAIKEPTSGTAHPRGDGGNPKAIKAPDGHYRPKQNESFSKAVTSIVDTRNRRDVWIINGEPFPEAHFAVFPEALVRPCILAGCPKGGVVLDPFTGSGTALLVAEKLGCNGIGIELNPDYIAMAHRRLAQQMLPMEVMCG
jgi:DNA modification methylase